MKHPEFCVWAGLLFLGDWTVSETHPTACVDKRGNTTYGRKFVDGLATDAELNFLILHEKAHVALLHTTRAKEFYKINLHVARRAIDEVVNNLIVDIDPHGAFATMPIHRDGPMKGKPMGYCDRRFKGLSLKEVFNILLQESDGKEEIRYEFDEHEFEDDDGDDEDGEIIELEKEIETSLRQGKYVASQLGGKGKDRLLGDLNDPQVDWQEQLAEFVLDVCQGDGEATWRRPQKRFVGEDMYFPTEISEEMGEMVYGMDVSASISNKELAAGLTEVVALTRQVRPSKLRLIYWDVGVVSEEVYEPSQYDSIIQLTRPKGGGGTDVVPVAAYINKLPDVQCVVIATDGDLYGGWGSWNAPVLWLITNKRHLAPVGKTLQIKV